MFEDKCKTNCSIALYSFLGSLAAILLVAIIFIASQKMGHKRHYKNMDCSKASIDCIQESKAEAIDEIDN